MEQKAKKEERDPEIELEEPAQEEKEAELVETDNEDRKEYRNGLNLQKCNKKSEKVR